MVITREREKLLEAIKYFAANTKHCGLTKLFKLLFFLDFDHFRETGRSVTGLKYEAWPMGPVPGDLYSEIKGRPSSDLASQLRIEDNTTVAYDVEDAPAVGYTPGRWGDDEGRKGTRERHIPAKIKALKAFNAKYFTKRELRLMEQIAYVYKELIANQISEVSHLKGKPWHVTKTKHGLKAPIDYMLALDEKREGAPSKEEILARIEEREQVLNELK
jgi:uncharacterized phage-associated protein